MLKLFCAGLVALALVGCSEAPSTMVADMVHECARAKHERNNAHQYGAQTAGESGRFFDKHCKRK